jgi:hypothetical protein
VLSPRCGLIGLEWIYSVLTMRTLYTLFALISLVLVALVATAAPPNPTLNFSCTPDLAGTGCLAFSVITFSGDGLNPHKSYRIDGSAPEDPFDTFIDFLTVNSDGTYSDSPGFLPPGNWTFTLSSVDHNGLPQKELQSIAVAFD